MAKRKTNKKITLPEFKTWLAGVQSMQPDDWHPSKENWSMILEQINNIKETVIEREILIEAPSNTNIQAHHNHNNPANLSHSVPSSPIKRQAYENTAPQSGKSLLELDTSVQYGGNYESSFAG